MPMFEEWTIGRSGKPELHPSQPYLIVECSIAKVFYGQNIYGGPEDFEGSVTLLMALLEKLPGVRLPAAKLWHVCRVDWAECFALPYQAIQEFFEGLRHTYATMALMAGVNPAYIAAARPRQREDGVRGICQVDRRRGQVQGEKPDERLAQCHSRVTGHAQASVNR